MPRAPTRRATRPIVEVAASTSSDGLLQRLDPQAHTITVQSPDSSPIAADFGLAADTWLTPKRAFRASFSFLGRFGAEVWRAPG